MSKQLEISGRKSGARSQELENRNQKQEISKWIAFIVCFCIFYFYSLIFSPLSYAYSNNNILRIEVMGSIPVSLDTSEPDSLALDDAFRKAVAKTVETVVPKGELDAATLILDDKVYSNASRYILNYRILSKDIMEDESSGAEGGIAVYTVAIEADIAVKLLTKDLIAAGILHEAEAKKILVSILGLRNYKVFELFRRDLKGLKGVEHIYYHSFARDKIELFVEMAGDAQKLKQEITAMIPINGIYAAAWKIDASIAQGWFSAEKIEIRFSQSK
ncbi:MAG: hypothetical protein HY265_03895 [Deltaproteobacteria bacterium]|nr:hypothetical protein [Deltaproteobacteria bacterium]MBI3755286.1 hypothetical protein [Deltaproteobacteria bacterium]